MLPVTLIFLPQDVASARKKTMNIMLKVRRSDRKANVLISYQ